MFLDSVLITNRRLSTKTGFGLGVSGDTKMRSSGSFVQFTLTIIHYSAIKSTGAAQRLVSLEVSTKTEYYHALVMKDTDLTKIRFIDWMQNLSDEEIDSLISDAQSCGELDRCFVYCLEVECDYYKLLLLARTPTKDFRKSVIEWVNSFSEAELKDLLEKGVICGEQSFCMNYCASVDCLFRRLIQDLCAISDFVV